MKLVDDHSISAKDNAADFLVLESSEQAKILQFQQDVLQMVAQGQDSVRVCEQICLLQEQLLPNAVGSIMLLDAAGEFLNVFVAPSIPETGKNQLNQLRPGPGAGSCGNAVYRGEPVYVENAASDSRWQDLRPLAIQFDICACWSIPIRGKGGRVMGTFALSSFEPRLPSPFHRKLLDIGSFIVGIVLEQQKASDQLLLAAKVFENSSEGILITDADNRIISVNQSFTRITGYELTDVCGKNPSVLSARRHNRDFFESMWQSIVSTGCWQGEIWNRARNGRIFPERLSITAIHNNAGELSHYLGVFADITDQKRSDQIIWHQANFDALTGLPNRDRFLERLVEFTATAVSTHQRMALLLIDIDHFKEVNDTLGHGAGDILLKVASERLMTFVRNNDLLARLGGDEFALILHPVETLDLVEEVAQKIVLKLAEPFELQGRPTYVSASIGVTLFPDDASDIEVLLRFADQAMYAAKSQGRNGWCYFTPAMQANAERRSRTASDLRIALAEHQFFLLYQPIVHLSSGAVHKAEALLRWQHPERGLISPAEFIPIAEETRLILELGNWVFFQAASQALRWQVVYGRDFQISVNKSPLQFLDDKGCDWVGRLAELGLSGHSVVAEITEGLLLDADQKVSAKLLDFRDAGIQVAIDDFGTGYSSLSYLKKFDIDYLKIDQSFIRNLAPESSDLVLCEAIITMAQRLGMKVIAEGVETEEQRDLLAKAGCDYAQGYLFARPLAPDDFALFMQRMV